MPGRKPTKANYNGSGERRVDTHIYLPESLKEQVEQEAKRTERTFQRTLQIIIRQYFEMR